MIPKPRKINRLYSKIPNLHEITFEGRLDTVKPFIMAFVSKYIERAKQLQSVDLDFRFLELGPADLRDIADATGELTKLLGVVGNENVTEKLRRKKRSRIESAVWWWEAEKGKFLKPVANGR